MCVLRLVDEGRLSLEDKAHVYMDPPMKAMWNTTFVELFGALSVARGGTGLSHGSFARNRSIARVLCRGAGVVLHLLQPSPSSVPE